MTLCPNADDIWLKAMTLKKGVKSWVVPGTNTWVDLPPFIEGSQIDCLANDNIAVGNDVQLKTVFDFFDLWGKLSRNRAEVQYESRE